MCIRDRLKRRESEEFLTLGIGIRARKSKKLESWYFCLTDGRRVGKDFFLYKEGQNKIACTKLELRNRIGDGGQVMDSQGEYAQCVNRLLFGFETMEEYKELLDLLIQLRTPKLSKDFKPTVINEILSSSLQTLSEDDLRPMSEAIENMDSLKTVSYTHLVLQSADTIQLFDLFLTLHHFRVNGIYIFINHPSFIRQQRGTTFF